MYKSDVEKCGIIQRKCLHLWKKKKKVCDILCNINSFFFYFRNKYCTSTLRARSYNLIALLIIVQFSAYEKKGSHISLLLVFFCVSTFQLWKDMKNVKSASFITHSLSFACAESCMLHVKLYLILHHNKAYPFLITRLRWTHTYTHTATCAHILHMNTMRNRNKSPQCCSYHIKCNGNGLYMQ